MSDHLLNCCFEERIDLEREGPIAVSFYYVHYEIVVQSHRLAELVGFFKQYAKLINIVGGRADPLRYFLGFEGLLICHAGKCVVWCFDSVNGRPFRLASMCGNC
jgi:hypothetical protein